ncbi:hypothetical protein ACVWZ3_009327 [Bradyrhizobium sp. i1.3.6]
MSNGRSAIFGIGNSAEMKVMPTLRASRDRPMAKPTATPAAVPSTQPTPMRRIEADRCCHSAPDIASS